MTKARDLADLVGVGVETDDILDGAVTNPKVAAGITGTKVDYDNTVSGISANTMQEAIDYLNVVSGGDDAGAQATYTRQNFIATAGQTTFTITDGYTLGYLQVYMNGILLAVSDYTANDETTMVLAEGVSAGTEITTLALDSFAISEVLRTLAISPSAPDDSITIDGSGNVLVGTTGIIDISTTSITGHDLRSSGSSVQVRDGGTVQYLNRLTSDGDIMQFRKDGNNVGSIGSSSGNRLFIGNGNTGIRFAEGLDTIVPWNTNNTLRDAAIDLGEGTGRFKDLYLSGGVYLGGTSGANKLDDYEEGTWVPTGNGVDLVYNSSAYVKVGNLVYITAYFKIDANSDTRACEILGLPFKSRTSHNLWQGMGMGWNDKLTTPHFWIIPNSTTTIQLRISTTGSSVQYKAASDTAFMIAGTYYVDG